MAEFADTLGTQQSTVSRYEADQLVPSRSILILLFLLAEGDDRRALSDALGLRDPKTLQAKFAAAKEQLDSIKRARRPSKKQSGTSEDAITFANEAAAIATLGEPIDGALIEFLRLWRAHPESKQLQKALATMLPYFRFSATSK
jgi:hypothetical protein